MRPKLTVLLALLVVAATSSALPALGARSSQTATSVNVRLKEFRVIPVVSSVRAGRITFVVRNVGKLAHEFVVLRTTVAPSKLPVAGAKAKEIGRVGKIPPFPPGKTSRLTLTVKPGRYVLLCNVPGHYKAGQFIGFRVR